MNLGNFSSNSKFIKLKIENNDRKNPVVNLKLINKMLDNAFLCFRAVVYHHKHDVTLNMSLLTKNLNNVQLNNF